MLWRLLKSILVAIVYLLAIILASILWITFDTTVFDGFHWKDVATDILKGRFDNRADEL